MQILAQEILKLSVTGGEDNSFLHPLFLILLFKHFLQATACNRTVDWLDLQLIQIEVVMVLSQIAFTTVWENMASHHHQVTHEIKFCNLYTYPKQEVQFSEDGIRKFTVTTKYILAKEMLHQGSPEFCMTEISFCSKQHPNEDLCLRWTSTTRKHTRPSLPKNSPRRSTESAIYK